MSALAKLNVQMTRASNLKQVVALLHSKLSLISSKTLSESFKKMNVNIMVYHN